MQVPPVSRLLPSPARSASAPQPAPALAPDQATLSGAAPPPPEQAGYVATLKGLFGAPSAALLALEASTNALSANGVKFRRHKKFLFFERSAWTEATPRQAAKLALRGRALEAARQSDFHAVRGAADLTVLDAFYGTQTPQSLPHAVLAQTFLDLEKSGARLETRNASLNAYSAYQSLPSTPVTVKTHHHRLTAHTEDDLLFTGWLTNPSTPVAAPEMAASARALEQRGLSLDGRDDDVLQIYGLLKSGNTFHVHEHGFVLGAADKNLFSDPKTLDAWAGGRQAELDAVQAAFPERAECVWQILRKDGDARPFAERLAVLKTIEAAREPAPLYRLVLGAPEPLAERAAEAAALLAGLGPENEAHAGRLFERLQTLADDARGPFLEHVRQVASTFTERLRDERAALLAWSALEPDLDAADFPKRLESLTDLTSRFGAEDALRLWTEVRASSNGTVTERAQRASAAHEMLHFTHESPTPQQVAELFRRLDAVKASPATTTDLIETARRAVAFHPTGEWAEVRWNGAPAWTDSPGGPYGYMVDSGVTTENVSLRGLRGARLAFDVQHELEQGYDHACVEVYDGRLWKSVAQYTGNRDRSPETVDLSPWDGQDVKLRFRIKTDTSNNFDGIWIGNPRVQDANGHDVSLRDHINAPLIKTLTGAATDAGTDAERTVRAAALARLGKRTGNVHDAARLWPMLAPHADKPDFDESAEALTAIAQDYGVDAAFKMLPELNAAGGPAALADRVALLRVSADLSAVLYRDLELPRALGFYQRLAQSGADRGVADALGTLVRAAQPWVSSGCWTDVVDDQGRHTWDDSPGRPYAPETNATLTSAPFSLHGLKSCKLRFDASFVLDVDSVRLQASEDGDHWTDLQTWKGKGEGTQEVDLAPWCDRAVQVRWKLRTYSNYGEGMRMSNMRLAVEEAGGQAAEAALDDAINVPISTELLDVATDPSLSNAERVHALHAVEQVSKKVGGVLAASMLWPVLGPHLNTPSFDGLVDVVGTLASKLGVGPIANVLSILQAEGPGNLLDRVKLFEDAHHIASSALSLAGLEAASLDIYRKLSRTGSDARMVQVLSSFGGDLQAWNAGSAWGRNVSDDGTRAWSDRHGRKIDNNVDVSLTLPPLTITDGMQLTFQERHSMWNWNWTEYCAVEVSSDGKAWTELERLTGNGSKARSLDLSEFRGKTVSVRFRSETGGPYPSEGVSLWDVNVTSPSGILAVEDAVNLPFLRGLVNAATDARVCPDERIANLDLLRGLPKGYARRILTFHDAHRDVPLSDLLGRVTQSIALDSDLDESLRLATLPAKKEGRIEMGGEEVVVGGIKVRKRKDPSA